MRKSWTDDCLKAHRIGAGVGIGVPFFKPAYSSQNNGKKFLQIFLDGGWDLLATDPVLGDKAKVVLTVRLITLEILSRSALQT